MQKREAKEVKNYFKYYELPTRTYPHDEAEAASKKYFGGGDLEAGVFLNKYMLQSSKGELYEKTPDDMHRRLAKEFARVEQKYPNPRSFDEIYEALKGFAKLIAQGSPMAAIGNPLQLMSLSNCFVWGNSSDSYSGIMKAEEGMVNLMKRRAGVGVDISHLRPTDSPVRNAAKTSTGATSFMERYSNGTREVAQCLGGSTLVLCGKGLKPIKSIDIGEKVWTDNGWVEVVNTLKNTKHTIKITTKYGKELICSKDHVISTLTGEKKAGELTTSDILTQIVGEGWSNSEDILLDQVEYEEKGLNQSNGLNRDITLPSKISQELAYFIGFTFGNGTIGRDNSDNPEILEVSTHEDNKSIISKLKRIIKSEFNYDAKIRDPEDDKVYKLRVYSKLLLNHLKLNGHLKQKAAKIEFPQQFLTAPKDIISSFISGYFDADGCTQKSKKVYKRSSISKEFLQTLQTVLQSFGIVTNIHVEKNRGDNWEDLYTLSVNGQKNQNLFRSLLQESIKVQEGPIFEKKEEFLRSIYTIKDFKSNSSRHSYVISNDQYISYSTCYKLNKDLEQEKTIRLLQDPIVSIEENEKIEVYDLTLKNTHLFFGNGLYVHNSGRRGALMITLSAMHPDIKKFIDMKMDETKVTGANISLKMSDSLMEAIDRGDTKFTLQWPVDVPVAEAEITKEVNPQEIWDTLIYNAWARAEPGCLFWDTIKRESLPDCYKDLGFSTTATNPCGEVPLSIGDSCRLFVINLLGFVKNPFTPQASFDFNEFSAYCELGQRLMDDLVDLEIEHIDAILQKIEEDKEPWSIKRDEHEMWMYIQEMARKGRRTGFGITAMGDMLAAMGLQYGTDEATNFAEEVMQFKKHAEYETSCRLAQERGAFPIWGAEREKDNPFLLRIAQENPELFDDLMKYGRRNIAISTIAPTGSVSLMAKTSSGIENVFSIVYYRNKKVNPGDKNVRVDFVDKVGDSWQEYPVFHPTFLLFLEANGVSKEEVFNLSKEEIDEWIKKSPYYGATSNDVDWVKKVEMQGRVQKHVDHSISVTTNLPKDIPVDTVKKVYMASWKSGCKGVTVYRDGCRSGVLNTESKKDKKTDGITHTDAPKRPKKLQGDLYHVTAIGDRWTVLVGLMDKDPYEVFAVRGEIGKHRESYSIVKVKSGYYNIEQGEETVHENFTEGNTEEEASLTRLISTALRHGSKIDYVVEQLNKSEGSIVSFGKAIARTLKKYITDVERAKQNNPLNCPNDGTECNIVYSEGCLTCTTCGTSKCT